MGFATSKAHKRETQGKYFYLLSQQGFYQDFQLGFKNLCNNPDENLHENILRENKAYFARASLRTSKRSAAEGKAKSGENL